MMLLALVKLFTTTWIVELATVDTRFIDEVSTIKAIAENSVRGGRSGARFMNAVNAFCQTWGTELLRNFVT